ncbi:hypothetical protein ACMFMF_008462 [Clarireedia jacksonii]
MDSYKSTTTDPHQLQSHFFKLPSELRTVIYQNVVEDFATTIHIDTKFTDAEDGYRRLISQPCTEPEVHLRRSWAVIYCPCYEHVRTSNSAGVPRKANHMSLLLICKRFTAEILPTIYSTPTFNLIHHPTAIAFLIRTPPIHLQCIQSLHLSYSDNAITHTSPVPSLLSPSDTSHPHPHPDDWDLTLHLISLLPKLSHLCITISAYLSRQKIIMLLPPLKRVTRVPKERFEVLVPWGTREQDVWLEMESEETLPFTIKRPGLQPPWLAAVSRRYPVVVSCSLSMGILG